MCVCVRLHVCDLRGATPWRTLWNLRLVTLKTSGDGLATYLGTHAHTHEAR